MITEPALTKGTADLNVSLEFSCVVLKPRLKNILPHSLATSWLTNLLVRLHNGGWGETTDPEEAADAVAASWGFDKVPYE